MISVLKWKCVCLCAWVSYANGVVVAGRPLDAVPYYQRAIAIESNHAGAYSYVRNTAEAFAGVY